MTDKEPELTAPETATTEEPAPFSLELNGYYWSINVQSDMGIPAVELDMDSGTQSVLIFTSVELAKKFCYLRNPEGLNNIYQISRTTRRNEHTGKQEIVQSGLIKIARRILTARLTNISNFILDHPGRLGPANYISMKDMAHLGRTAVPKELSSPVELSTFLNSVED